MKSMLFVFTGVAMSLAAYGTDLGGPLAFKLDQSGKPAFGVVFSHGNDPDGTNYLFTYTSKTGTGQRLRWNFYSRSQNKFLLDWSPNRVIELPMIQVKVGDEYKESVEQILRGQKMSGGNPDSFFVLATEKDVPVYHVSISDLCAAHPDKFKDISYNKRCDQVFP